MNTTGPPAHPGHTLTQADRADVARVLRTLTALIESGDITASAATLAYLHGLAEGLATDP